MDTYKITRADTSSTSLCASGVSDSFGLERKEIMLGRMCQRKGHISKSADHVELVLRGARICAIVIGQWIHLSFAT